MRPVTITMNLDNTSATKVAAAQTLGGAGNLVLAAAASAIDSSGAARILLITTTENDSARTLTITGTDVNGNAISETITGAGLNNTTTVSTKLYKSVSSIASDGAIAANISVGTTNTTLTAVSQLVPLNYYSRTGVQVAVEVTGTVNFTVQETFDPILANGTSNVVYFSPSALASKTSSTTSNLDVGATGMNVQINSYSNGATLTAQIITVASTVR